MAEQQTIKVRNMEIEVKRISKILTFKDTRDTLYFRVENDEDNPDDHSVVPSDEGYDAIEELFLERKMNIYNDAGESPSTGFCQRERIGIENALKQLDYGVQQRGEIWVAIKLGIGGDE